MVIGKTGGNFNCGKFDGCRIVGKGGSPPFSGEHLSEMIKSETEGIF